MSIHKQSKVYFDTTWGFFIGSFTDNAPHKHFAVQISIALTNDLYVIDHNEKTYQLKNCLIKSNIPHRLLCKEEQVTLLIYPTTAVGHYFNQLGSEDIVALHHKVIENLRKAGVAYVNGTSDFVTAVGVIKNSLEGLACECKKHHHFGDDRVQTAITYLEENADRVIPLEEIAEKCFLSPSRFLHLFKEKTGITYRRVQLWNKLSQSLKMLPHQSITATAHQFGFTDSAHYSKVFSQTFGFSPKSLPLK